MFEVPISVYGVSESSSVLPISQLGQPIPITGQLMAIFGWPESIQDATVSIYELPISLLGQAIPVLGQPMVI